MPSVAVSTSQTYREEDQSDSEDEFQAIRTPWRSKRRVVLESDSSENDLPSTRRTKPGSSALETDSPAALRPASGSFEFEYDISKHYDSSVGSLRDFIVSDSDSEVEEVFPTRARTSPISATLDLPDITRLSISKPSVSAEKGDRPHNREEVANRILDELNRKVFASKLSNVEIMWNKRLLTTAGQAKCKR